VVSGNGMAGLLHTAPLLRRRLGNIVFVGDAATDSAAGHPPMAPRVTQCAAMMAEVVLDIVLGLPPEGEAT
jgi:sulfur carrier protein ThiS adenylyltransferase